MAEAEGPAWTSKKGTISDYHTLSYPAEGKRPYPFFLLSKIFELHLSGS